MSEAHTARAPFPPRLSMDEYAEFVERSMLDANPVSVARQKALEKRIRKPFRMTGARTARARSMK